MMIVITPNGTVKSEKYENLHDVKNAVHGNVRLIASSSIAVEPALSHGRCAIPVDYFANFRCDEDINYFGCLISGKNVHGNVVIVESTSEGNCGFDYEEELIMGKKQETFCEVWALKNTLRLYLERHKLKLQEVRLKMGT